MNGIGVDRHHGRHRLDRARPADTVPDHALGAADGQLIGVLAEDQLDGRGLGGIVQRRGGAVRIDVVTSVRAKPGIGQRPPHRARRPVPGRIRLGRVKCVGGRGLAQHLGIDARAAGQRMLVLLQHHHRRALADHKPVPLGVKGPAGLGRRVVAGGQHAHAGETREEERVDLRLSATRQHHIRTAVADQVGGLADGLRAGCARGSHGGQVAPGSRSPARHETPAY